MPVKILYCGCNTGPGSEFQDRTYGKGMRVCNETIKVIGAKCSSCGSLKR